MNDLLWPDLTPREREVILLLAAGLMQWEIAKELGISRETVKTYMASVRAKAGGLTNEAIVADAVRFGLIHSDEIGKRREDVLS